MRPATLPLSIALLLAGCAAPLPNAGDSQGEREVSLHSAQTSVLKGSERMRAGGFGSEPAQVVSAGAGNVVSAGGGNVTGESAPASAPLLGGAGGNVISAGGGNLSMGAELALTPSRRQRGEMPQGEDCGPFEPSGLPGTLAGTLEAPGELIGVASGTVPVTGAPVGLYQLDGSLVAETVASGGAFTFAGVPQQETLVARSLVRVGDRTVYLSSLVQLDAAAGTVALDPVSTVMEGKYLALADGTAPVPGSFVGASWLAVRASALAQAPAIPLAALEAGASIAARAALYDAWAIKDGLDTWNLDRAACGDGVGAE